MKCAWLLLTLHEKKAFYCRIMSKFNIEESNISKAAIIACDLVVTCGSFLAAYFLLHRFMPDIVPVLKIRSYLLLLALSYGFVAFFYPPILLHRVVDGEKVFARGVLTAFFALLSYASVLGLLNHLMVNRYLLLFFYAILTFALVVERLSLRMLVKHLRSGSVSRKRVIMVGSMEEMASLYSNLSRGEYGFTIDGVFTDDEDAELPEGLKRLGRTSEAVDYVTLDNSIYTVYCSPGSMGKDESMELFRKCMNVGAHYFALPLYISSLHRNMVASYMGSCIMLSPMAEPLSSLSNRALKRMLDIFVSVLFLATLFPIIYLIVAIKIKRQSPGPVFFVQKRTGLDGKDFKMLKFRSMHINEQADTMQATQDDPRKFPFGDFMRRTSIDELPQFINVFFGSMSVVGPRPHMTAHTAAYSRLINQYMIRHWVKPGITGWAQVNGFRGETRELELMEKRVHADIWYVEHWSFWLDVRLILRTFFNTLFHKESNAY